MNSVSIVGRLTRDPEGKTLNNGTQVANFTVAVNRNFKNKDGNYDTDFIPVEVMGKPAEFAMNYMTKGRLVSVLGSIRVDKYQDKDGNNKTFTKVSASNINALDKKTDGAQSPQDPPGFQALDDDSIPF